MRLSACCYTNQGGRDHNEDSVRCCAEQGVFVLSDGLGGHGSGEVASALAADILFEGCSAQEEMKTTAVALSVAGDLAVWGHVGDSRLYRFSGGALSQETRDHSVTYMKYLGGEISYMDIYHDDDRPSLLRALGKLPCKPEAGQAELRPGDAFLLCSDGFWEYVYQEEVLADLLKAETPEQWAQLMLLRHIRRTPPGNDNFSLITVFAEEEL